MIDDVSDPGSYADKFKDAPYWYAGQNWTAEELLAIFASAASANLANCTLPGKSFAQSLVDAQADLHATICEQIAAADDGLCIPHRCYRDRKAKERLKDTTNAIRAKLGMELL